MFDVHIVNIFYENVIKGSVFFWSVFEKSTRKLRASEPLVDGREGLEDESF